MKKYWILMCFILLFLIANSIAQESDHSNNWQKRKILVMFTMNSESKFGSTFAIKLDKHGYYINGRYGKFPHISLNGTYDNHSYNERFSITSGYIREMNKFIDIYGGLGYGYIGYKYVVNDFDSKDWINYIHDFGNGANTFVITSQGLETELGIFIHYRLFYASIGISSLNFKSFIPVYGLGIGFKF